MITGCTQTTPTNHLHYKTHLLALQDHINMQGTQFLAAASANPDNPCHYMLAHQPTNSTQHQNYHTCTALYTGLLNTIPQHSSSHIHTDFTNIAIQKLSPNIQCQILPPPPPPKYITQNMHHHVQTEYTLAGFVEDITLLWQLTEREQITPLTKSAHTSTNTHSLTHIRTHHNISSPQMCGIPGQTVCFFSRGQAQDTMTITCNSSINILSFTI